ncbi:hypothetical protein K2Z84_05605 [Candidatus Binatia bacterium]|nr:hypothetical protein [Candidatus Binatia bacterium]
MQTRVTHRSPASARAYERALARALLLGLLAALVPGCSRLVTTPAPSDLRTVVVLPVDNRTGSPLDAEGPLLLSILGREPSRRPVTAPDLLTDALRSALERRGVEASIAVPSVGAPAVSEVGEMARLLASSTDAPDPLALRTTLRVWESTSRSHLLYVAVALDAALVDREGRTVWSAHLPATPIDGGGASSVALGYPEVARRVAELVTADLGAAPR